MHELSIASSIINIVLDEIKEKNVLRVNSIGLRIGTMSGILPEALEFGFDAIKQETPLKGATLVIEEVPLSGWCNSCQKAFTVQNLIFACPVCNSASIKVVHGDELDISYIEIEEKEVEGEQ